jgi:hypothetical protein
LPTNKSQLLTNKARCWKQSWNMWNKLHWAAEMGRPNHLDVRLANRHYWHRSMSENDLHRPQKLDFHASLERTEFPSQWQSHRDYIFARMRIQNEK